MGKKITLGIILILFIVLVCILYGNKDQTEWTPLFEIQEYQNITIDSIKSINILRYTEAGSESKLLEDQEEIENTYHYLKNLKIGDESNTACEDNTTVYVMIGNETETAIEIECDNLVMGNKRYRIKKVG